jgi:plastocyanin
MQKKTPLSFKTARFRIAGFCLMILALLTFLAACGGSTGTSGSTNPTATATTAVSTPTSGNSTPTATTPSGNAPSVSIANFSFSPATLSVSVGTKVTWTNNDSVTHTVTADQGAFDSSHLSPGSSFSFTFSKAGTYTYHCNIHASMKATVIVK